MPIKDIPLCVPQYLIDQPQASDIGIAEACSVAPSTIHKIRKELGIEPVTVEVITLCQLQYIVDHHQQTNRKIAEHIGVGYGTVRNIKHDLGLQPVKKQINPADKTFANVTPWQLAKRTKYDTRRTHELLVRHGYEGWGRDDVAWLCSEDGRLERSY